MPGVSLPKSSTEAGTLFSPFLLAAQPGRDVVLHDSDADGLAAAVLLTVGLSRLGRTRLERVLPDRSRSVWTQLMRERLSRDTLACLYVLVLALEAKSEYLLVDVAVVPFSGRYDGSRLAGRHRHDRRSRPGLDDAATE
jgi:hypothetical protein